MTQIARNLITLIHDFTENTEKQIKNSVKLE